MSRSDRELMVAFQGGDPEAFDVLLCRYQRMLANYFYKQCYDRTFAQDLVQETFLRILRSAHRYRPEAKFKTFLFTVARNLWIDHHRSRKAAPRTISADLPLGEEGVTLADLVPNGEAPAAARLEDREAAVMVREALQELPDGQREVWLLAVDQDLKQREIAQVLDIPLGTVKSRMNAAVTRLRGLLGGALR
ncbi:MAG: RNA polymerase sigma factor [Planctomycetota bacterium]|jgi:RNA polymerase sigma-70 factor (ECF subfamily)